MGGISYDDSTFFRSLSASKVRNGPFVYVGRISSEKNIQNLCFAYALYREASSEPRDLLLIGPIENYDLLHEQPGIKYEGFQSKNEIALRLNSCRAFLFPSIREPFGVALLEAGACGAPLLTSANVGASDHLVNADNGFIVDSNNPHEICARLLEFDEWDEVALQRASDASSAASLYFSPENWVARFEKLCKKANKRKSGKVRDPKSVHFYLAVIPKYRSKALELLESQLQKPLTLSASAASSDSLVHTDDSNPNIGILGILNFRNKFFLQTGKWCKSIMSDCLVLDLNPRSLTAWFFLILRFPFYKKRTLVWGHLNSRFQSGILNRRLRIFMRYLADGAILYTYSDFIKAKKELPKESIFIAPNAIYSRDSIERSNTEKRNTIIYSGRLVREKKVDLLLSAFKESGLKNRGITLCIIGDGPEMSSLKKLASELDLDNSINFVGESFDYLKLKESYSRAIVSVSPGYVGLSLTQSAGFGVPMILAEQDNHSPEIELVERGNHYFFNSDDFLSLSQIMQLAVKLADNSEFENSCERMVEYVRKNYSAEQMAEGLHAAIFNLSQKLGVEGFPFEN